MKSASWKNGLTPPANPSQSRSQVPTRQEQKQPCVGSGKRSDCLRRRHRQSSQKELSRREWRQSGSSRREWSQRGSVPFPCPLLRQTGWFRHRSLSPRRRPILVHAPPVPRWQEHRRFDSLHKIAKPPLPEVPKQAPRIRELLQSQGGLRAAVVLSEILGPPKSLRERSLPS